MLYYICPLHSSFFLLCAATWGIANHLNDRKYVKEAKLALSGLFLCLMFDVAPVWLFDIIWSPLSWLLSMHGTLYEWHFRTMLDHYATWLGMVFAVYYEPIFKFLTVYLEGRNRVKIGIGSAAGLAIMVW